MIFKVIKRKIVSEKRVRGIKSNNHIKEQEKVLKELRDYSEPLEFLELSNFKFKPEDRTFILVGLYELIEVKNEEFLMPDNFIFSVIALFDSFIQITEKYLSRKEMVNILYACINLISKEQNLFIFNKFKDYFNSELEIDILEAVDYQIYPEKVYDYFSEFYYQLSHKLPSKKLLNYLNEFKNIFLNSSFFLLFDVNSINDTPINKFQFCLRYSFAKLRELFPIGDNSPENFLDELVNKNKYSEKEYLNFKCIIKKGIVSFNDVYNIYRIKKQ